MPEEVFISYGSVDRERIQDLVSRMRQAGVTVWIDEAGIEGAAMWSEEIVGPAFLRLPAGAKEYFL